MKSNDTPSNAPWPTISQHVAAVYHSSISPAHTHTRGADDVDDDGGGGDGRIGFAARSYFSAFYVTAPRQKPSNITNGWE